MNSNSFQSDGGLPANICTDVFETLAFFLSCSHSDICKETLKSMGNFCVKNFEYLTKVELRDYYHYLLTQEAILTDMKVTVLRNILIYLTEEENKMVRQDKDCKYYVLFIGSNMLKHLLHFRANSIKIGGLERNGRRLVRYG